jgi:putative transposase
LRKVSSFFNIVKPETVLKWSKEFIKKFWTFPLKRLKSNKNRISTEIKELVLRLKNENLFWGYGKIQGELLKLNINISKSSIKRILKDYRRKGKVKKGLTWNKFIRSHINSLFAMDFFTVDTILGKRFYVFFIISLATREIVHYNVTMNPTGLFIRNQLIEFSYYIEKSEELRKKKVYLIHDQYKAFKNLDYKQLGINNVITSYQAPNMNAYAERFVRSVGNDVLEWFILFSEKQIRKILKEYIDYYNSKRPHQGINQAIPLGYTPHKEGKILSKSILSGLYHHYEIVAA